MLSNPDFSMLCDIPKNDPTRDDQLYYGPFARHLANGIQKMFNPNGFVISINGDWGSGKTTILNYVKYYLNQEPEDTKPVIIEFNPWWFSGRDDLIRQLFMHFGKGLSRNLKNAEKITELFGEYLLAFSSIVIPKAIHESINKGYTDSVEHIKKQFDPNQKSVEELKNEITTELSHDKKILVIIDDIDRLNPVEMQELFQVIKTVADFPNVVFLLAFDKKIVTQCLQDRGNLPGEEYLEKILQASFNIPYPEKGLVKDLLSERLKQLFSKYNNNFFEDSYWLDIFNEGISELINTPRDIVRFINSLNVTYPSVCGEVNPIDFIAIEALRLFQPETYDIIRKNPSAFAGYGTILDRDIRFNKMFYEEYQNISSTKKQAIDHISTLLFPIYCQMLDRKYPHDWRIMRRDLHICAPEIFPTYFWMTIPDYRITHTEIKQILECTDDAKKFKLLFLEMGSKDLMGVRRVNYIFSRLIDHAENNLPFKNIEKILPALYEIPDNLKVFQEKNSQDYNSEYIEDESPFLRRLLLSRLIEKERYTILKKIIKSSSSVYSLIHDIQRFSDEKGNYTVTLTSKRDSQLLTEEHITELKKLLILKLRKYANSNELLKCPNLKYILKSWYSLEEDTKICRNWIQKVSDNDENLIKILGAFITVEYHASSNQKYTLIYFKLEDLKPFIEIHYIYQRIKKISDNKSILSQFSRKNQNAIKKFLDAYYEKQKKDDQNLDLFIG